MADTIKLIRIARACWPQDESDEPVHATVDEIVRTIGHIHELCDSERRRAEKAEAALASAPAMARYRLGDAIVRKMREGASHVDFSDPEIAGLMQEAERAAEGSGGSQRFGDTLEKWVTPKSGPSKVTRGHCSRCDRCGWEFRGSIELGCVPGNCAHRPLPSLRTHCAGCGAEYEADGSGGE